MKKSYLYEIPLCQLALFALERAFFPENPGFAAASPHPYWLLILLFALRYGLTAGALSGALAAAVYLAECWTWGQRFRFEDAEFYLLPGSFLAAGAVVGAAIERLYRTRDALRAEAAAVAGRARELEKELEVQRSLNRTIEQQVVSQMSSLVTLYEGARSLNTLDRQALLRGVLEFFASALHADAASIYLRDKDLWRLHEKLAPAGFDRFPACVAPAQGLIGRAGSENRVVSLRDAFGPDSEKAWAEREKTDAILAGPLRRDTGELIGIFAVQSMDLLHFGSGSVSLLGLLLDWAEAAISKCLYFEELSSKLIADEILDVYNENYFKSRSRQEFIRSATYALPFSVLLISLSGAGALPPERRMRLLRSVSRLLQAASREIDIVTKYPDPEIPFAVLMMTASAEQARELSERISLEYERLGLGAGPGGSGGGVPLKIGIGSYAPQMKEVDELLAQARAQLR